MKKDRVNIVGIGILYIIILISCKSGLNYYENQKIITKSCELEKLINTSVVVQGVYYECMEYNGFQTSDKGSCKEKFDIYLNFEQIEIPENLLDKFYQIHGCTGTIKMTIKGILKNDSENGYGHLGSNNSELIVQKVIDFGKVKYIKP
ncbi:hypothetical protein [Zunongwangia endophytica]|uniref:Lipoprotein n=1 Tax=Zunongwangia endophytica TaxID=1808945 RepID=A0ABV8H5C7_9FLAO|nr:hypothetical protein [Zunongwangia endophytica]MDN3593472.1 hypothetical protein [Zunongwangia endophytica]